MSNCLKTAIKLPVLRRWQYLIVASILLSSSVLAQESQLGKVEFKTSGSEKAQSSFLRGLAALHSFWYEEASEAFRESTRIDPEFMMGYWGEAMALNHPLWSEQDTPAARQVIAKIRDTPRLSARERSYLAAVKILYGEGDRRARDLAYSAAMEKIYLDYPEDLDAAAFYALSLLGLVDSRDKSYRLQAKAGAIALAVYEKNPNHPGAAHYIIHAFDDPDHAILALPAARRYAGIAPAAHHARHMPSHIFLQLGMWPEAVASNESAWEASEAWVKRKNLSPAMRDYHSLHWLLYCYLQQGRYSKAEELVSLMKKVMTETTYENKLRPAYYANNYANMAAAFIVESERWELAPRLFPATISQQKESGASDSGHGTMTAGAGTMRHMSSDQLLPPFIRGLSAAVNGSMEVSQLAAELEPGSSTDRNESAQIMALEINALNFSIKGEHVRAIELMKKATALEEDMGAPSGPPFLIKPSHELYGEILLRAGKPKEAAEQFQIALMRQPNRARSLLGAARAAAKTGDLNGAAVAYSKFLSQWQKADEGLPELREARAFEKQARRE